jgi:glutamate 5-kinase
LLRLHAGEALGSLLEPSQEPVAARKRWLAAQLPVKGSLTLDPGAVKVLVQAGRSLLPVGVTRLTGQFQRGDLVSCVDADGREIARGLVNYSSLETSQIIGKSSHKIQETLGYVDDPELIHRDNLTLS